LKVPAYLDSFESSFEAVDILGAKIIKEDLTHF
jgi:hypothetical protein